jgi:hypothetical protein
MHVQGNQIARVVALFALSTCVLGAAIPVTPSLLTLPGAIVLHATQPSSRIPPTCEAMLEEMKELLEVDSSPALTM